MPDGAITVAGRPALVPVSGTAALVRRDRGIDPSLAFAEIPPE